MAKKVAETKGEDSVLQPQTNLEKKAPVPRPSKKALQRQKDEILESSNANNNSSKATAEVADLTAQLEKITLERNLTAAKLEEAEAETLKLREKLNKLGKQKAFEPALDLAFACSEDVNKKDPRKPKKPLSAYLLWCNNNRSKVVAENPGASFAEVTTILGAKWKAATAEDKEPFEQQYKAAVELYEPERKLYDEMVKKEKEEGKAVDMLKEQKKQDVALQLLEAYLEHQKSNESDKKMKRDVDVPKRPLSSFIVFSQEKWKHRSKTEDSEKVDTAKVAKEIGDAWGKLTEEERAPYMKIAEENKLHYAESMQAYAAKKQQEDEQHAKLKDAEVEAAMELMEKQKKEKLKQQKLLQLAKEMKMEKRVQNAAKKEANADKPKRPPSGSQLFSQEMHAKIVEDNPDMDNAALRAAAASQWKALGEAGQKTWMEKAAPAQATYKVALAKWKLEHPDVSDTTSLASSAANLRDLAGYPDVEV